MRKAPSSEELGPLAATHDALQTPFERAVFRGLMEGFDLMRRRRRSVYSYCSEHVAKWYYDDDGSLRFNFPDPPDLRPGWEIHSLRLAGEFGNWWEWRRAVLDDEPEPSREDLFRMRAVYGRGRILRVRGGGR